jgi:hypothetical protein
MPSYTENGVTYTYLVMSNGNMVGDAMITGTTMGSSLVGDISIPSAVNANGDGTGAWVPVVEIAVNAFMNAAGLTSVIIPDSVVTIGTAAFFGTTNLSRVIFSSPFNLVTIGDAAFSMSGLTMITIPSSVTSIGSWAFKGTQYMVTTTILSPNVIINGTGNTGAYYESGLQVVYHNSLLYVDASLHPDPWSIADFFGATNSGDYISMIPMDEPTMTITASEVLSGTTSNETSVQLTFVSSDITSNFIDTDITVLNGTIGEFSPVVADTFGNIDISGSFIEAFTNYTATFTSVGDGICSIDVPDDTFTTMEGIHNIAATTFSWTHDATAPVMSISSYEIVSGDGSIYSNNLIVNLIFTSTEVTSNFAWEDIVVTNGILGTLTPVVGNAGLVYTAAFTPTATNTLCTINVASDRFTDDAGNPNTVAQQFSWTHDITSPSMTITAAEISTGNGTLYSNDTLIALTFTSNEVTNNFTRDDIVVTNGNLGTLVMISDGEDTGKTYTATFTPTNTDTLCTINVVNDTFTDVAGNNNTIVSQFSWTHDVTPPVMTITASEISVGDGTLYSNVPIVNLTFTSTKPTTNFIWDDIIVVNGIIGPLIPVYTGSDTGKIYTATFTPTVTYGICSVNVDADVFTDVLGNNNTVVEQFYWTYDIIPPSMLITSSEISSGDGTIQSNATTVTLSFETNKTGTEFSYEDIVVTNGVLGALTMVSAGVDTGKIYNASFTPTVTDTICTVNVVAGSFVDAVGNANTAAHQFYWLYDVTAPTMLITATEIPVGDGTHYSSAQSVQLTFTSSEPTTDFTIQDITVTNGTLGSLTSVSTGSDTGKVYTAIFTPAVTDTLCTINVFAARFVDVPGNTNTGAVQFAWNYDVTSPSIVISVAEIPLGDGSLYSNVPVINVSFISNEVTTDFAWDDISVTNGILGQLVAVTTGSDAGKNYTATFTPTVTDVLCTINVTDSSFIDAAGNPNTAAEQFSWTHDITAPTMVITSSEILVGDGTVYSNAPNINLTFTASEVVTGFEWQDITVTNGVLGQLIMVSAGGDTGKIYTAIFAPTATDMLCTINIAANIFVDVPGNNNTVVQQFSWTHDVTAPSMVISAVEIVSGDGSEYSNKSIVNLTFTPNETITDFVWEDVIVTNGVLGPLTSVSTETTTISIYTATFTPTPPYALCTIDVFAERFSDIPGNLNTGADQFSWTYDVTPPTMVISSLDIADGDGSLYSNMSSVFLIFTTNKLNTGFVRDDIVVTNGILGNLNPVSVGNDAGKSYTATFFPTTTDTSCSINVSAGIFVDVPGNENTAAPQFSWIYDVTPPTAAITYSTASPYKNGDIVIITATFSEPMSVSLSPNIAITGTGTVVDSVAAANMTLVPASYWVTESNPEYTYSYLVPVGDGGGEISLSVGVDRAGNAVLSAPTSGSVFMIDNSPPIATVTYDLAWPYKGGNIVTFTATVNKVMRTIPLPQITITGDGIETVSGAMTPSPSFPPSSSAPKYTYAYSVPVLGDGIGSISLSLGKDLAGNEIVAEPMVPIIFMIDNTPPSLLSYVTVSNNGANNRAKIGDEITVTFQANEEVIPIGIVIKSDMDGELIPGSGAYTDIVATDVDNEWRTVYTVHIDDEIGPIQITITYKDLAGNYSETVYTHSIIIDIVAPEIILNGEAIVYIDRYEEYIDAGATAYDTIDDVGLTTHIVTVSTVNTNNPGTYTVTYDVLDVAGNAAIQMVRTIIVRGMIFGPGFVTLPVPICFPAGTCVLSSSGLCRIECLRAGVDRVNGVLVEAVTCADPFPWVSHLVRVGAGSLGVGVPAREFLVSPAHRLRVCDSMVPAESLLSSGVPGVSSVPFSGGPLFNVLLSGSVPGRMTVCGVECETLDPRNLVSQIVGGAYSPASRDSRLRSLSRAVRRNDARAYVSLCAAVSGANRARRARGPRVLSFA